LRSTSTNSPSESLPRAGNRIIFKGKEGGCHKTKIDLVENVCVNSNLDRKEAVEIVEIFLYLVKNTLAAGEEVKVSGFGKFVVNQKHDRKGRPANWRNVHLEGA